MAPPDRRSLRLALSALLVLAASCSLPEAKHFCATDADCLSDKTCQAGSCRAPDICEGPPCGLGGAAAGMSGSPGEAGAHAGQAGEVLKSAGGQAGEVLKSAGGQAGEVLKSAGGQAGEVLKSAGGHPGSGEASKAEAGAGGTRDNELQSELAGVGGSAGDSSDGAGTANLDPPSLCDPYAVEYECASGESPWFRPMLSRSVDMVTVIGTGAGSMTGFHTIAARSGTDTVVVSWTNIQRTWNGFGCFDSVPSPRRAAATRLQDGQPEFFVVGRCGLLHERAIVDFGTGEGWTPWVLMRLPWPDSVLTDVDASLGADGTTLLYVVDRSTAYVRHGDGPSGGPPFGPWRVAVRGSGATIAASTRSDGRQQLFTLDAGGHPRTTVQSSDAPEAPFGAWQDFDSSSLPGLIGLDTPNGGHSNELFALDDAGRIWTREQKADGAFTPWNQLSLGGTKYRFKALSSATVPPAENEALALVAIEDAPTARVYVRQRWNGIWQDDWQALQ